MNRYRMLLVGLAGLAATGLGWADDVTDTHDPFSDLPPTLNVSATVRDFKAFNESGGHPDFQRWTGNVRVGLTAPELDEEGKPALASVDGQELTADFHDSLGQPINPTLFAPELGDTPGRLTEMFDQRVDSAASFAQWYRDGLNTVSTAVPLVLTRVPNTDVYVFDSNIAEPYHTRGGFFPIDGMLYGNYAETGHNFHFTTELESQFLFRRGTAQTFKFSGDDDVWVYIAGRLVIDLGGVHSPRSQTVNLDRLDWLTDGETYQIKIFHAERRTSGSNFRIETSLQLRQVQPPAAQSLAD